MINCSESHPRTRLLQMRLIVPGYVGTRSVKWLQRILFSATDSQSPWQQIDYRPAPPSVKVHEQAKPQECAPLMALPVQSAILVPTAGSIIAPDQTSMRGEPRVFSFQSFHLDCKSLSFTRETL